jgi:hypothetical protein
MNTKEKEQDENIGKMLNVGNVIIGIVVVIAIFLIGIYS